MLSFNSKLFRCLNATKTSIGLTFQRSLSQSAIKRLRILFGSQTGTAEGFSRQLARESEQHQGLETEVMGLNEMKPNQALINDSQTLNVLFLACFGKGEATDNAKAWFNWLSSTEIDSNLKGTRYALFGLGKSKVHSKFSFQLLFN